MPPEVALELGPLTAPVWEAWELLNGARRWSRGMDGLWPDPIALSEILALVPVTGQPATLVLPVLRALDDVWLADVTARLRPAKPKPSTRGPR